MDCGNVSQLRSNDFLATLLVLLSAFTHAIMNLLIKFSGDKLITIGILSSSAMVIISPALFIVDLPTLNTWLWLGLSIAVHLVYSTLLARAYQHHDLSVAYPLSRGAGVLVSCILAGIFLREPLNLLDWLSIGLVLAGIISISGRPKPVWILCGLIGFCIGTYTAIDAQGSRAQTWTFIVYLFVFYGMSMGFTAWLFKRKEFWLVAKQQWPQGLGAGAASLVSYGCILLALNLDKVADVVVLRETSLVFGALLSVLVLKEVVTRVRWVGVVLISLGAILSRLEALNV